MPFKELQILATFDMQWVYAYIASSNHILVITMGEASNVSTAAINLHVDCRQYLFTYSQADESKFSTQESFEEMLYADFNAGISVVKVDYWACSREEHQNDAFHPHSAEELVVTLRKTP